MTDETKILLVGGIILLWLICQKWFWIIGLSIGALASVFAVLASIIHFQIAGALGFTFLALICSAILGALIDA